jgi:thiol-disulfide isomerase/thioredoxin/YHS domain-containing protein
MSSRKLRLAALALFIGMGTSCASTWARNHVPWAEDLPTAQRIAASQGQLVMVHFTADWCGPCQRLEKNVFNKRTFGHAVAEKYVPVKIDVGLTPGIAKQFGVTAWPTDVLITPAGQELHRMVSPQSADEYVAILRQVAWRKQNAAAHQVASAGLPPRDSVNPPQSSMTAPIASHLKERFAATQAAQHTPTAQQAQFMELNAPQAGNHPPVPPAPTTPPLAQQSAVRRAESSRAPGQGVAPKIGYAPTPNSPAWPPATVGPTTNVAGYPAAAPANGAFLAAPNPHFTSSNAMTQSPVQLQMAAAAKKNSAPPSAAPPAKAAEPAASRSTDFEPETVINGYVSAKSDKTATPAQPPQAKTSAPAVAVPNVPQSAPMLTTTEPPQNANETLEPRAHTPAAPQTPTPTAPPKRVEKIALGMDGYCPVTLFEQNQWAAGDKRWGARHRGTVYLFQNAAAQQQFLSDPDRYSPMLSGYDPVSYAEKGEFVAGKRDHGIRFRDQFVLFASEESLRSFSADSNRYVEAVRQAMRSTSTVR